MQIFQDLQDQALLSMIAEGKVGILPTDTIYGLVCRADNEESVTRLYLLKHREHKPGTIIAANREQLVTLGLQARYLKSFDRFWPGSVSAIIPTHGSEYLRQGVDGLAVRIPGDPKITEFLRAVGPLLTTSANMPGEQTATNLDQARAYFGDRVDFYVDGGDMSGRPASTVIRIVDDAIEVLREGVVKIDETGRIIT
jgi:L-threonylcarbamoyladenylate synthase